ncbi:class I SAM-dependent methyltransferase [Streptomyces sp. NPDC006458]|uniref:class I SAM-dependent methyltransferase n=1 Tax=Streptomyces sp. NPDC006458 TaxID=3154302 RepID=UPI0033BC37E6
MNGVQPTSDRIMQLINGYWATGILGTAAEYSVFTHLADGAGTAGELAVRAGISPRGAQAMLDGLVSIGLVEPHEGRYRNTAEAAAYLVEGPPSSLTGFAKLKMGHMAVLAGLPEAVRVGGPVTEPAVEVADNPHWAGLVQALAAQSAPVAEIAADTLKLAEAGGISILDIGGGSGVYSAIWLDRNPDARSTQLDWAPINAIAGRLLTERGVADRVTFAEGDLHSADFGESAHDIVTLANIAHQEGPDDNVAIFARIRNALKPGGTLVISEYVVDDDRGGPPFPLTFAAEMLLKSRHGNSWSRADYHEWLVKAGFEEVMFQRIPSPSTLIFAR